MITSNRLPLMKRSRLKSIINHNINDKKHGMMIIMNTNEIKGMENKFKPIDIKHNNLVTNFYSKRREQIRVGNRNVVKNLISERERHYVDIESELTFVQCMNEGKLKSKYNFITDLIFANKLFKDNTVNIARAKKPLMYWDFIMRYISDLPLADYPIKNMIINGDEFANTIIEDLAGRSENVNPIAYLYLLMKREENEFFRLGNFDILITSSNGSILRINPEECKKLKNLNKKANLASMFRRELFLLLNRNDPEEVVDDLYYTNKVNAIVSITNALVKSRVFGAAGDSNIPEEVKEKIEKHVEQVVDKMEHDIDKEKIQSEINKDEELIKAVLKATSNKVMNTSIASNKRDELLREKQLELSIKDKTLEEILSVKSENIEIPVNDVTEKVNTLNKNMTEIRYPNINKAYVEELMEKDLTQMFIDMNNKSLKVFVRSISVADSSDVSNYKETYTVDLEDELRVRHRLVFDVPKVIDGRFLYLGGNRKFINNQQLLLPIIKVEPDTVQLVSNYNKIFIRRYGDKVSNTNEKFKKALSGNIEGIRVQRGKYDTENDGFVTTIDYDDMSRLFKEINIKGHRFVFDQKDIRTQVMKLGIPELESKLDKELLPLGNKGNIYYCIDLITDEVITITNDGKISSTGLGLIDYMCSLSNNLQSVMSTQSVGKKFMYSRATVMTKQVPIVLLLAYFEGMDGFLKRANVKHYFSDTRPRVKSDEAIVEFADGYLVYTQKPMSTALLMNGFIDIPTKNYKYSDFNDKFMYQPLFESMFGRRNIANAFDNFKDNFIDPMTMDVLQRLSLPTDITGMILYGNELLADNQFTHECLVSRVRCAEVISAIVYKNIAKAYEKYKETSTYSNPAKISLKQNAIIKEVLEQQIVEDFSELNPVSEQQNLRKCLRKGPSGCNLAQAYTEEQRSYHPAMAGLFSLSSSPDGNVGVNRYLTMEPPIADPRGFIDNKTAQGKIDDYTDVNLFGIAEALTTGCASGDDSIRTTMSCRQSTHCVATAKASPVLISNGAERVMPYHVSKDWVFSAKEDGVVKEYDIENNLFIVQYDSGECEAIELNRIAKNGAGGFNLSKSMNVNFNKGDKFKKNDILAYENKFFSENSAFGNRFNVGSFQKVAFLSSSLTYEDSSYVSKKLSREMATEVVMQKQAVLGPNTNIDYMVKVGDKVESGDELIRFERSHSEDALNALLLNVGEDMKEEIAMSGKDKIKSKFTGVVEDIKIFCTVDLDQLSPSLRSIVEEYHAKVNRKKELLEKYDNKGSVVKCNMLFNETTDKVDVGNDGKLRGAIVNEGVLIEFYVKVYDEVGVGDKIVFFSALKSIVGNVINEGQEAYTLFRPEESIDAVLSCNSIIARGVSSAPKMVMCNKLLVELSRKLKDIYDK